MDTKSIGQYIQLLRKQQFLSQKDLAERLGVSFQAVSKWETGENLPDVSILLDLADVLDTTTDKLLSGGSPIVGKNKRIKIDDVKESFAVLDDLKALFGEDSLFYLGAVEGINRKLKIDAEEYWRSEAKREEILTEVIIRHLINGFWVDHSDIDANIKSPALRQRIRECLRAEAEKKKLASQAK